MSRVKRRRGALLLKGLLVALVLATILGGQTVAAQADDETVLLSGDEPVSAVLKGGWHAGSFDYYQIEYPGNVEMRISLEFQGMDPTLLGSLGFNVYGPGSYDEQGAISREPATLELFYRRDAAATLYVQVYNYSLSAAPYTIAAEGAATVARDEETDQGGAGADGEVTGEAATIDGSGTLSGTIVGNRAGAFSTHTFWYDGSGDDVFVQMTFAPTDPSFANALGFEIWVPGKGLPTRGVAPKNVFGLHRATLSSDVAGDCMIKVYNYAHGVPMSYDLTVNDQ